MTTKTRQPHKAAQILLRTLEQDSALDKLGPKVRAAMSDLTFELKVSERRKAGRKNSA